MPLFFGFIGFTFPAGLVLYWTTSNLFQIGQQTLLLRAGHIGPDALEKRMAEQKATAGQPRRRAGEEGHHSAPCWSGPRTSGIGERPRAARPAGSKRHRSQGIGHSRVEPARNRQGWVHEGWHHQGRVHEGWRTP